MKRCHEIELGPIPVNWCRITAVVCLFHVCDRWSPFLKVRFVEQRWIGGTYWWVCEANIDIVSMAGGGDEMLLHEMSNWRRSVDNSCLRRWKIMGWRRGVLDEHYCLMQNWWLMRTWLLLGERIHSTWYRCCTSGSLKYCGQCDDNKWIASYNVSIEFNLKTQMLIMDTYRSKEMRNRD